MVEMLKSSIESSLKPMEIEEISDGSHDTRTINAHEMSKVISENFKNVFDYLKSIQTMPTESERILS